jgi:hypothetical protein
MALFLTFPMAAARSKFSTSPQLMPTYSVVISPCAPIRRIRHSHENGRALHFDRPPGKALRALPATLDASHSPFGATDARKYGATIGATNVGQRSQKVVAMQENPAGSAYCPSHNWSYNARVLRAWQSSGGQFGRRRRPHKCKSSLLMPRLWRLRLRRAMRGSAAGPERADWLHRRRWPCTM